VLFSSSDCARARESVSAQLDGELSDLGLDRLATHLLNCPACTAWAAEVRDVTGRLRDTALEVPALTGIGAVRRSRRWAVSGSVALAAAAAVVATMFAQGQQTSAGQHRSSVSRFAGPEVPTVVERPLLLDGRYAAVSVARAPQGSLRAV
jgi:predicted anti-sigma-YlaC factor YlaD